MSDTAPQLRLYNTLTRSKEVFTPIDPANVRMYVCGPTVYDYAHIGNARPVIVFDVLYRLLRLLYGLDHVKYVRNITDVEDKINARAVRDFPGVPLNEAIRAVTQKTADQFVADGLALGNLRPDFEPRATEYIPEMIEIAERLIARGHAYVAGGEVLFSVPSMAAYGQLSRRPLDEMIAGARIDVAANKRNPMDFVLWKPSAPDEPGWQSPWSFGRPGWHIECSAMSKALLGETFDIHGGGIDLVFPHHENEVAQNRCAFGHGVMANVWMHNGFLQIEGHKMSKSLGNFVTIRELLNDWPGDVLRLNMLGTHYRQPIDWTKAGIDQAEFNLSKWRHIARGAPTGKISDDVLAALADDLNTPKTIAVLHQIKDPAVLKSSLLFLGIDVDSKDTILRRTLQSELDQDRVNTLITARLAARAAKNWAESDRIRDELAAQGITLKDNKDGTTTWEVKR
jgi:cysteinyl-tRNA synthetase